MFQITSYLQYRNTPDGKPRILREAVDYTQKTIEYLEKYEYKQGNFYDVGEEVVVANLADCRPLLTVEIDGVEWTEGDITKDSGVVYFDVFSMDGLVNIKYNDGIIGVYNTLPKITFVEASFFDDPAKYSKLLWNCSEAEGSQKIFKLLDIQL